MFYLSSFVKIITNTSIKGILFLLASLILIFAVENRQILKKSINKYSSVDGHESYFNILVSENNNYQLLMSKLGELPGIKEVKVKNQKKIKQKIDSLVGQLKVSIPSVLLWKDVQLVKVILKKGVTKRTVSLIKEYIVRLIGQESVVISTFREKSKISSFNKKNVKLMLMIKNWGEWIVLVGIFAIWFAIFLVLMPRAQQVIYLVEQFQRKSHVGFKSFIAGFTCLLIIATLISSVFRYPGVPGLYEIASVFILFFISACMYLKKDAWGIQS